MNKKVLYSIIGTALLALCASPVLYSKAHVPLDRVQVCDPGGATSSSSSGSGGPVIKTIKVKNMAKALSRGACRHPACDFGNVKMTGDSCDPADGDGNGLCDNLNPPNSGVGATAQCTQPF